MIVKNFRLGHRQVYRIYQNGVKIWEFGQQISLNHLANIFTAGYHAMLAGETVVLTSNEAVISVPDIGASVPSIIGLSAEGNSETVMDGNVLPLPAIICVCDTASMTRGEIHTMIANAVSFVDNTDILSNSTTHSLISEAIYGKRAEDIYTTWEAWSLVADAVYGEHGSDITTDVVTTAEVSSAVYGTFTENNANVDNAVMYESPSAVIVVSQSDNKTESIATMLPFRIDGVVEMDTSSEIRTNEAASLVEPEPAPLTSMLRLVTTCRAHMFAASAAGVGAQEGNNTAATIFLHFEGEKPEESWYDPVQTGSDLYIRSAWLFWNDGDKGHIDTDVWYEVIREGSNLYIRSVGAFWRDDENGNIDLSEFYKPRQQDGDLYLRSAHSVWTEGDGANIDLDYFLEPVREGSNLYIRQDIFGGV